MPRASRNPLVAELRGTKPCLEVLSKSDLADRMATAPARIAGLGGHGRPLAVGEPANLVLVDPDASWTVERDASRSRSRNNPWHGRTVHTKVEATFLRGACTAYRGRVAPAGGALSLEELS